MHFVNYSLNKSLKLFKILLNNKYYWVFSSVVIVRNAIYVQQKITYFHKTTRTIITLLPVKTVKLKYSSFFTTIIVIRGLRFLEI